MSILIKGMEMPKNCEECFFLGTDNNAHWYCYCQKKKISITSEKAYDSDCPLVPVPPHGDLIERKAAYASLLDGMVMTGYQSRALDCISECYVPTIIESEE